MHEAMDKGALLVSRENGKSFEGTTDHVAPERRPVTRQNLKEWIAREFPADKPEFLFDEVERKTHSAINADAFRALQADRDAAHAVTIKTATRSSYAAQRNAGQMLRHETDFPDCAARHPGYIPWLSRNQGLSKHHSLPHF